MTCPRLDNPPDFMAPGCLWWLLDVFLQGNDVSTNTEGLSKEELGRLVASRWTGNSEKKNEEVDGTKDNDHEVMPQDTHEEEYDGYASETDDDTGKYDDADIEDDIDETYEEDVHDDASPSYKSDSDDELDLSGLQLFVLITFFVQCLTV